MADVKISGLPAATTPLAGTEVLPIVQSSATKKVSIADVTAGRAVSALSMTATNLKTSPATANLDISGTTIAASGTDANVDVNINAKGSGVAYLNQRWGVNQSGALVASAGNTYDIGNGTNNPRDVNVDRNVVIKGSSTGTTALGSLNASASNYTADLPAANTKIPVASQILTFSGPSAARTITLPDANISVARTDAAQSFTGDQTLATGNLVIGTSGKGIDFSATPGTGLSELLNDYEEGTWTPAYGTTGNPLTSVTYNTSVVGGKYIKVGNVVHIQFALRSTAVNATGASGSVLVTGLPFTIKSSTSSTNNGYPSFAAANTSFWGGDNTQPLFCFGVENTTTAVVMAKTALNSASSERQYSDLNTGNPGNILYASGTYVCA